VHVEEREQSETDRGQDDICNDRLTVVERQPVTAQHTVHRCDTAPNMKADTSLAQRLFKDCSDSLGQQTRQR